MEDGPLLLKLSRVESIWADGRNPINSWRVCMGWWSCGDCRAYLHTLCALLCVCVWLCNLSPSPEVCCLQVKVEGENVVVSASKAALGKTKRTMPMAPCNQEEDSRVFLIVGGGMYVRMLTVSYFFISSSCYGNTFCHQVQLVWSVLRV